MTDTRNVDQAPDIVDAGGVPDGSRPGEPGGEASPFGAGRRGRAARIAGGVAIAVLVGLAAWVTWFTTRGESPEVAAAGGHQHGAGGAGEDAAPVRLDADAARRIGVTFATAVTGSLAGEIRTVGQVTFDETRVKAIAPKVDGWVEQLFVDFTGREVHEGEPLLSIYSPMLVAAQEELLLALRLAKDVENGTEAARRAATDLVSSARRRLAYWDIPTADVEALERNGTVTRTLTLRAPVHGVVIEKAVLAGQRIMDGATLFRVADLGTVWVEGEVFERDLASVRLGAPVAVELESFPGEARRGAVTYVYPTVDPATRTTRVRVELANPGLRLRPGMYATIRVPGARRAGVVTIPRSAVLATGKRVVVFVRMDDGMLAPREVVTGLASDDQVEVVSGLRAGEVVVASATFLVDAESNLGAAMAAMGMGAGGAPAAAGGDSAVPPAAAGHAHKE